jgi:hypothetical protein
MSHYWTDPLHDNRWAEFVNHHPLSSVFHTPEWISALHRTYGFTNTVLTTSPPDQELANGILLCRPYSLFRGKHLVSLPFSDHCQPLAGPDEMDVLFQALISILNCGKLKFVEIRPLYTRAPHGFGSFQRFYFHWLDLRPSLDSIFRKLHGNCIRRKIRRAEREGITSEAGRSDKLLDEFYSLQVSTRRRFGLPPQPLRWFKNLIEAMGECAMIRVARFQGRPIAAILMLSHKKTAVYKYGCSHSNNNNRGGTQLILWQAIEDAKSKGMELMDLGRSDMDNLGLIAFKERWGAERKELEYFRCPAKLHQTPKRLRIPAGIMARIPDSILITLGRLLYRHMA